MIFFSFIFCTNFPWSQGEDILSSSLSKKGRFKVCKCYDIQRASIGVHFPWRCIWVLRYLKQFLSFFFSWAATMYETLTVDNLKNWHMVIGACCLCARIVGKPVEHLLLYCSMARDIWSFVFSLLVWIIPKKVYQMLEFPRYGKQFHYASYE